MHSMLVAGTSTAAAGPVPLPGVVVVAVVTVEAKLLLPQQLRILDMMLLLVADIRAVAAVVFGRDLRTDQHQWGNQPLPREREVAVRDTPRGRMLLLLRFVVAAAVVLTLLLDRFPVAVLHTAAVVAELPPNIDVVVPHLRLVVVVVQQKVEAWYPCHRNDP